MPAPVPLDVRASPVLPQATDLLARVDHLIGEAGVDEPASHRHPRFHGQRRDHPAERGGEFDGPAAGVVAAQSRVAAQQFDEVRDGHAEDCAQEVVVEAGDQRGDEAAQRHSVHTDRRVRLFPPDPRQQAADVVDGMGGRVDVVEHVLAREHRAFRQPRRPGTVHRKHRQHDVEAELLVQVPGPEQRQVNCGAAHLGPVHAHQPRPRIGMPQHQPVAAGHRPITQPAITAGLAGQRTVSTLPTQP